MTYKDIIKAFECCIKPTSDCDNCPYYGYDDDLQCFDLSKRDALDLINRQQAEIGRLKNRLRKERHQFEDLGKMYSEIRAEAIKEFADRLKNLIRYSTPLDRCCIDNIVKEMVGEK